MKLHGVHYLLLFTALAGQGGWADAEPQRGDGFDLYAQLRTQSYSNADTLARTYDDPRAGAANGGDLVFTHNRVELGVSDGEWQLGMFWRTDYRLEFNDDTARFLHQQREHIALEPGSRFALEVDGNHVTAMGAVIGKRFRAGRWTLDTRVHFLRATDMVDGRVAAQLTSNDPGGNDPREFAGTGHINYAYSKDELLGRPRAFDGVGYGLGLDLGIAAQLDEHWRVSAQLEDAPTLIYWRQLPFTDVALTLARPRFAPDGTLDTQPLATGREYKRNHLQHLPVRYEMEVTRSLSPGFAAFARLKGFDTQLFPQLGLRWQATSSWQFALSLDVRAQALVLGLASANARAEIVMDDARPGHAHMAATTLDIATSAAAVPGAARLR